ATERAATVVMQRGGSGDPPRGSRAAAGASKRKEHHVDVDQLNKKFGIPEAAEFSGGWGDMPRLEVETELCKGELYLHGAHVTQWRPTGNQPVLWTSMKSFFRPDKPIRGGVPICFPWFGPNDANPQLPSHGFARVMPWAVRAVTHEEDGAVTAILALEPTDYTLEMWDCRFEAVYTVRFGTTLTTSLEIRNVDTKPIAYTQALHHYFTVADVRHVEIEGLSGAEYVNQLDDSRNTQGDEPIRFEGETDRVYVNTDAAVTLADPGKNRLITVEKAGSQSTVIWNPWIAKASRMADFYDEDWPDMVCIETANARDNVVNLNPEQSHTMSTTLSVEPLRESIEDQTA
ncbi:MAG: D-hexose-6-phosphate mutarotase, partial [Phycisphaerae bacterium]